MERKRHFILACAVVLAIVTITSTAWAAKPTATECTLIGSWMGSASSDLVWTGIHTAGSTSTNGEMLMNWLYVSTNLVPEGAHMTPGTGIFQQIATGKYNYAWYAFVAADTGGVPMYTVRVSGIATLSDCNNVAIDYTYEIYNQGTNQWSTLATGQAQEMRIPLEAPTAP